MKKQLLSLVVVISFGLGADACSDATSGKRVLLRTSAALDQKTVTSTSGWEVTLERATVSVSALYYFDGGSLLSWLPSFGTRAAHAHPGHYEAGNAMGQMLSAVTVDLAPGEVMLPAGEGVTGSYRSARIVFGGLVLDGTAKKQASIPFHAELGPEDLLDAGNKPNVDGCAFEPEPSTVESDGAIKVRFSAKTWLGEADFSGVAPPADGKPVTLDKQSIAFRAIARAAREAAAYRFTFTPQPRNP